MSELSDKFEAFWICDEHVSTNTVRVDSTANAHNWTSNNVEFIQNTGFCDEFYSLRYTVGGFSDQLSQASSAGLSLGNFDWEINGWCRSDSGGAAGVEGFISKSLAFPSPLCYSVYYSEPAKTLTLQVRDAADTATGTVVIASGIAADVWFNWGAYHDATSNVIGVYINAGTPTEAAWSGGVLTNAGAVFTSMQSYYTGRGGFKLFNMGVVNGSLLTQDEREYLAGALNGNCPPEWPFEEAPGSDIAFEGYIARCLSGQSLASEAYGTKTYFLIDAPIAGTTRKVQSRMASIDGMLAGDKINLKMRRDGDDPNDDSDARCTLTNVRVDYQTVIPGSAV
jgi:hypothetical protein